MLDVASLAVFLAATLALNLTPGPDNVLFEWRFEREEKSWD